MTRRIRNSRNDAGSLLASTFIVAVGAGCCIFVCLAVDPRSGMTSVAVICTVAALFLTWIALQRWKIPRAMSMSFLNLVSRNPRDDGLASQYRPRKIRSCPEASVEVNQPLSVDQLREIQSTSASTWVPSKIPRAR